MIYFKPDHRCMAEDIGGTGGNVGAVDATVTAPDSAPDPQTAVQPVAGAPQPRRTNPLANVRYGIQPEPAAQPIEEPSTEVAEVPQGQENTRASFDDLIAGDYKEDYQRKVQATIADRLKGSKQREEKVAPLIQALAEQYGKEADDLDGIREAMENDSNRTERNMLDLGVDERTAKRLAEIKANNEKRKQQAEAERREMMRQEHFKNLQSQAEQMKQLYPGFDLEHELKDTRYFDLTTPEKGLSLEEAYMAIHGKEIMASAMQYAVERSAQKVAASVQSNSRRPSEAGVSRAQPIEVKSDPTKFTKADRSEIRRRVAMGETIVF